jgi:hypothetical protein
MIRYLERRLGSSARNISRKWGSAGGNAGGAGGKVLPCGRAGFTGEELAVGLARDTAQVVFVR